MKRTFYYPREAYYYDQIKEFNTEDKIYLTAEGLGTDLLIHWILLSNKFVPCLKAFNDTWKMLYECQDMLKALAQYDSQDITPQQFIKILLDLGFEDIIPRTDPDVAEEQEMFSYLNDLRDSGITNMFAAPQYLQDTFGLNKQEAREVFMKWIEDHE